MKLTTLHTDIIFEASEAEKISSLSEDEWINYYRFKGAWGLDYFDCVMHMKYHENSSGKSYEFVCTVSELEENKVVITIFAGFTPVTSMPDWKIRMCYPEPEGMLAGIIYQAPR